MLSDPLTVEYSLATQPSAVVDRDLLGKPLRGLI
jgi:hypothetical protein